METYSFKIIQTLAVFLFYVFFSRLIAGIIRQTLLRKIMQETRGAVISKVINLIMALVSFVFVSLIWGVRQSDLVVFMGSVLTVIGVALFAQWSFLSNITSSVIMFFSHPVKINDDIIILEAKDYEIKGKVLDIGLFFVTLETEEGVNITLPNNVFIQKSIKNTTNQIK